MHIEAGVIVAWMFVMCIIVTLNAKGYLRKCLPDFSPAPDDMSPTAQDWRRRQKEEEERQAELAIRRIPFKDRHTILHSKSKLYSEEQKAMDSKYMRPRKAFLDKYYPIEPDETETRRTIGGLTFGWR